MPRCSVSVGCVGLGLHAILKFPKWREYKGRAKRSGQSPLNQDPLRISSGKAPSPGTSEREDPRHMAGAVRPGLISASTVSLQAPQLYLVNQNKGGRAPSLRSPVLVRHLKLKTHDGEKLKEGKIARNFKNWASSIAKSYILT